MTPTAPVVPATIRRCGRWAIGWSASCTAAWPSGWPTRSSWPGRPPSRSPDDGAGGAGGCNPRRYWPRRWPGGRWGSWGTMPRGQARWDGRARRLLGSGSRRRRHYPAGEVGRMPRSRLTVAAVQPRPDRQDAGPGWSPSQVVGGTVCSRPGMLGEEAAVAFRAQLGVAAVGVSPALEAEAELGPRERSRGSCLGEPAQERPLVGRWDLQAPASRHPGAGGLPPDLEADAGRDDIGTQELEAIEHAHVLGFQGRPPPVMADLEGVAGQLHHPEQARSRDAGVEVMDLGGRTGLEQVNSYEGEQAAVPGPILGDIGALHGPEVGLKVVLPAVAASGGADGERTRGSPCAWACAAGITVPTVAAAPVAAPYLKSCRRLIIERCVVVSTPIALSLPMRSPSERLSTSGEAAPLRAVSQYRSLCLVSLHPLDNTERGMSPPCGPPPTLPGFLVFRLPRRISGDAAASARRPAVSVATCG